MHFSAHGPEPPPEARFRYDELVDAVRDRLPACGSTSVVAVDGPSGSGKSELADTLARRLEATILRVDELVPGWHGLAAMPPVVARDLLAPLAAGEVAEVRRWNWIDDEPGERVALRPGRFLVLDGCGSGSRVIRPYLTLLVWVDAPEETRRERAMARDGAVFEPWWDVWAAQERALFAAEQTQAAADVRLRSG
ncbi:AAA family ATPase [Aeromicrobium sp.]|uniref:AAA family ATPase n=1 Tax=Aeromicrobium sp. TaxID=1871063 RepID=UPI003C41FEF8